MMRYGIGFTLLGVVLSACGGDGGGVLDSCAKADNRCDGQVADQCAEHTHSRFEPATWEMVVTDCAPAGNECKLLEGIASCVAGETPCDCGSTPPTCEAGQEVICTAVVGDTCYPVHPAKCEGTCKADGTQTLCALDEAPCQPESYVQACDGTGAVFRCNCVTEGCYPTRQQCPTGTACRVDNEFEGQAPIAGCYLPE